MAPPLTKLTLSNHIIQLCEEDPNGPAIQALRHVLGMSSPSEDEHSTRRGTQIVEGFEFDNEFKFNQFARKILEAIQEQNCAVVEFDDSPQSVVAREQLRAVNGEHFWGQECTPYLSIYVVNDIASVTP